MFFLYKAPGDAWQACDGGAAANDEDCLGENFEDLGQAQASSGCNSCLASVTYGGDVVAWMRCGGSGADLGSDLCEGTTYSEESNGTPVSDECDACINVYKSVSHVIVFKQQASNHALIKI